MHQKYRLSALSAIAAAALGLSSLVAAPAYAAEPTNTIAEVQGTGEASPLAGTTVTVEGVVTADHRVGGYAGIYIQTQGSGGATDQTPGASDGVFVYLGKTTTDAAIGDLVRVTGPVSEYYGLTQITASAAGAIEVVTPGVGVPAATPLPDSVRGAAREAYEGMLVEPTGTYKVASSHQLYNYGTLWLSAGADPLVKNTEAARPGADADAVAAANRADRIFLDDGYNIQVSNKAYPGDQPYFTKNTVVRNGDTVDFPAKPYVLSYGFDDWRLQPTVPITDASPADLKPTFEPTNPRPEAPPAVGGDFAVASFNVENYFTTLQSQNADARGAKTAAQLAVQKSKIVAAVNALGANIVTLEEIENGIHFGIGVDDSLADLVDGLNAAAGGDVWAYVPTPAALRNAVDTTDVIMTAIIYKKNAVTPVGDSKTVIDESVWGNAREPIAQTFTAGTKTLTVVSNHFKSKGGGTGDEPADGQGFFNADRVAQAKSVLAFVNDLKASSGSDNVLLLGDFNSYSMEDPIRVFTDAGMVDLVTAKAKGQYTYSYDGEVGSLDHALATPALAKSVAGAGVWDINAPEWSDRGYAFGAAEAGTPFRASDHNPIKVGITEKDAPIAIDVLSINDFHGRLEAGGASGGAAVLAGAVDQYRAANPNTLFVSAGDNIGASTFTSFIQQDKPTLDALNAMKLDASALGNHEFDHGVSDIQNRVIPAATFPYLAANVVDKTTGDPVFDAYTVKTVDGVRIGFIGAITEQLPSLVSPAGIADVKVTDVTTAVNRVADQLRDGDESNGEADVTMLLVHDGAATPALADATDDSEFGRIVTGVDANVDAIISGHTHQLYNHEIAIPGTDRTRPVLQSAKYGEDFGHTTLTVDPQTKALLSISSEVLPLNDASGKALYPADSAVAQIVADAVAVAKVEGAKKVGDITADFNRARQSDGSENRGGESTLGNFVADVQLWAAKDSGAEVALMNPGGLRADLTYASSGAGDPDGNVTYAEAAAIQPFANTLVTETLTGAQLKQVLEEQWQPAGSSRPFLKLGASASLTYTYDPGAAAGSHITHVYLNGSEVGDADTHTVVVNSFLAAGGDNFFTLAKGSGQADTGKVDLQAMVDYFIANPTASPDYAQRAVGVALSAPAASTGYAPGESVTANLSSLLFSAGEPAADTVQVSIGDTVLATSAIDPAIVDTTDEVGRASVTFAIPAGLSGAQSLTISVPATGTSISVPIAVQATQPPVEQVRSLTIGVPSTLLANHHSTLHYAVQVVAQHGTEATGTVSILDRGKVIATVQLAAGDHGRARVKLPTLSRGLHLLSAHYEGSDAVKASTSIRLPVLLW
ncbi:ExeM/NucH family extracellular endonuclease [Microbacterium sp. STN6]|uniref:ExeM/NucH family extracellular endonuclease n=1 Tax=Microbacterium sp. STN6 TaxID=2995588 RepID=UPI002260F238|nr:ExeM/NucH family extracellular endonuclease [Microbacterium sp. STN6]MCX7523008.1 ExeM/NucH family extracellular endonuclease [Microbacterium sp. STN6]